MREQNALKSDANELLKKAHVIELDEVHCTINLHETKS